MNAETLVQIRHFRNVLLGAVPDLPPCLRTNPHVVRCELVAHFAPSRYQRLGCYLTWDDGRRAYWACIHRACWEWAEARADQLCPLRELPEAFYQYVEQQATRETQLLKSGLIAWDEEPEVPPLWHNISGYFRSPAPVPWPRIAGVLEVLRRTEIRA